MKRQIFRCPDEDLTKSYTEESDYVSGDCELRKDRTVDNISVNSAGDETGEVAWTDELAEGALPISSGETAGTVEGSEGFHAAERPEP
jgi:hypothetical protein